MDILNRLISLALESNNSLVDGETDNSLKVIAVDNGSSGKTSVFSQLGAIRSNSPLIMKSYQNTSSGKVYSIWETNTLDENG